MERAIERAGAERKREGESERKSESVCFTRERERQTDREGDKMGKKKNYDNRRGRVERDR